MRQMILAASLVAAAASSWAAQGDSAPGVPNDDPALATARAMMVENEMLARVSILAEHCGSRGDDWLSVLRTGVQQDLLDRRAVTRYLNESAAVVEPYMHSLLRWRDASLATWRNLKGYVECPLFERNGELQAADAAVRRYWRRMGGAPGKF